MKWDDATQAALLSDVLDGYIAGMFVADADGHIIATIVERKGSAGWGPFARRYVKAVTADGLTYAGTCADHLNHMLLRRVK